MAKPLRDLAVALLWLTRLPVAWLLPRDLPVLARAAWAFPLVGLVVGLIAGAVLLVAAFGCSYLIPQPEDERE